MPFLVALEEDQRAILRASVAPEQIRRDNLMESWGNIFPLWRWRVLSFWRASSSVEKCIPRNHITTWPTLTDMLGTISRGYAWYDFKKICLVRFQEDLLCPLSCGLLCTMLRRFTWYHADMIYMVRCRYDVYGTVLVLFTWHDVGMIYLARCSYENL